MSFLKKLFTRVSPEKEREQWKQEELKQLEEERQIQIEKNKAYCRANGFTFTDQADPRIRALQLEEDGINWQIADQQEQQQEDNTGYWFR